MKKGPSKPRTVESEYSKALQAQHLDSSEYIVLSMGYLESNASKDPAISEALNQIREHHANGKYAEAKALIAKALVEHPLVASPEMVDLITKRATGLKDNPDENHNRRFIETRLAEALENNIVLSGSYASVAKFVPVMQQLGIHSALKSTGQSVAEARENILKICLLNDNIEMGLKSLDDDYKHKDRFEKSTKPIDKAVASRNLGVMKAVTPNFYDLITNADMKGKVADRFRVDTSKAEGFSATNANVPFINSISGTTFTLAAILTEYMKQNKGDPNLQTDVNNMVRMFMAVYVKQGFHSLGEMTSVLNHPNIKKLFDDNKVTLDLGFPPAVLNQVYEEAKLYTKVTCVRKEMQDKLKVKVKTTEPIVPVVPAASSAPSYKSMGVDVGKIVTFSSPQQAGRTYMEFATNEDKQKAFDALIKEFKAGSVRIAGRDKTIEFLTDNVKQFMKIPLAQKVAVPVAPPTVEPPKAEPPKAESPKAESPKAESPKAESPKAEPPKVESPTVAKPALSPEMVQEQLNKQAPAKWEGRLNKDNAIDQFVCASMEKEAANKLLATLNPALNASIVQSRTGGYRVLIQLDKAVAAINSGQALSNQAASPVIPTVVDTKPSEMAPTLEALAPQRRPSAIIHALPPVPASFTPDALLNESLKKGKPMKFEGKTGEYIVFKDKKEMEAAVKSIQAKFGEKACRVSANPNTIEIYADVQKHLVTEKVFQAARPDETSKTKLGK